MSEDVREQRVSTAIGDIAAWYGVAGFSHAAMLDAIVRQMLSQVAAIDDLRDGTQLRFGWSTLTVQDGLLWEPAYATPSPMAALADHVTVSAQVNAMQSHLNGALGMSSVGCAFADTIVVADGALETTEVLMVRGGRRSPQHSGWQLMPRNQRAGGSREIPTCGLLGCRPGLVRVLTLPPGSIVLFDGETLTSVRDADNNVRRLPADAPGWIPEGDEKPVEANPDGGWLGRMFG